MDHRERERDKNTEDFGSETMPSRSQQKDIYKDLDEKGSLINPDFCIQWKFLCDSKEIKQFSSKLNERSEEQNRQSYKFTQDEFDARLKLVQYGVSIKM